MRISFFPNPVWRNLAAAMLLSGVCTIPAHAAGVVGTGTGASCTEAALNTALTGGGNVTFNCGGTATIVLTATKNITVNTNINGGGLIALDGNASVRHFYVSGPSSFALAGLTLTNGKTISQGGAILADTPVAISMSNAALNVNQASGNGGAVATTNGGSLTLTDCIVNGNQAGNLGGAIFAKDDTSLSLTRVSFNNNQSVNGGGAIYSTGVSVLVNASAFSSNSTTSLGAAGGAVYVHPSTTASLSVLNSTFASNSASNGGGTGGAISMSAGTSGAISNSTFADNAGEGTLEVLGASSVHLSNSIVSNTPNKTNCGVTAPAVLLDDGNNIQFGGTVSKSCGASIAEIDPKLGGLANNGGFTNTMALLVGSPAIDAGNDAVCPVIDQRGVGRPIGAHCDIGAFEAPLSTVATTINNGPPPGGIVATPYSFTYAASGTALIAFSLGSGALPPGLNLSTAGVISGTPTAPGTFTGSVTATNGTQPDAVQAFSITIAPAATPIAMAVPAPALGLWGGGSMIVLIALAAAVRRTRTKRPPSQP